MKYPYQAYADAAAEMGPDSDWNYDIYGTRMSLAGALAQASRSYVGVSLAPPRQCLWC